MQKSQTAHEVRKYINLTFTTWYVSQYVCMYVHTHTHLYNNSGQLGITYSYCNFANNIFRYRLCHCTVNVLVEFVQRNCHQLHTDPTITLSIIKKPSIRNMFILSYMIATKYIVAKFLQHSCMVHKYCIKCNIV